MDQRRARETLNRVLQGGPVREAGTEAMVAVVDEVIRAVPETRDS